MGQGWEDFTGSFKTLWGGTKAVGSKIKEKAVGSGDGVGGAAKGLVGFVAKAGDKSFGVAGKVIGSIGSFAEKNPGIAGLVVIAALFNPVKNFVKKYILGQELEQATSEADLKSLKIQNNERAATIAAAGAGNNPNGVNWVQQAGKGNTVGRYM